MSGAPQRFRFLIDPMVDGEPVLTLEIPEDATLDDVGLALVAVLRDDPEAERIGLVVGKRPIGGTSRARLENVALWQPGTGGQESAGLTLPGSPRFRALRYRCKAVGCAQATYRMRHDEGHPPACPKDGTPMVLAP